MTGPISEDSAEAGPTRSRATRSAIADILGRSAVLVAGILLLRQAQGEAQHRRRSILLEELLAEGGAASAELQRRAARAGIALDESAERWAWLRATQTAKSRHVIVGTVRDGAVPGPRPRRHQGR